MEQNLTQEQEKARLAELLSLYNQMEGLDTEITDKISLRRQMAIRSGEVLIELKESLGHGPFVKWVEQHLPYTIRTAQRYIRRAKGKSDKLSLFEKTEDFVSLINPSETEQDRLDRMNYELEKQRAEGKGPEKKRRKGKKREKEPPPPPPPPPPSDDEAEETDYKPARFLKLVEKGKFGDATINDVVETVNFATDQKVQDQVKGAREFFLFIEKIRIIEVIETVKDAFKHLWEMNKHG
jgi:hypothetical protein